MVECNSTSSNVFSATKRSRFVQNVKKNKGSRKFRMHFILQNYTYTYTQNHKLYSSLYTTVTDYSTYTHPQCASHRRDTTGLVSIWRTTPKPPRACKNNLCATEKWYVDKCQVYHSVEQLQHIGTACGYHHNPLGLSIAHFT